MSGRLFTCLVLSLVAFRSQADAQAIVELDLPSCRKLLAAAGMQDAYPILEMLANNYRKYDNVRVRSNRHRRSLSLLARALRTDFDGSGPGYVKDANIWLVSGSSGNKVFLAASMMDPDAVLLAQKIENMMGMVAFELLAMLKSDRLSIEQAGRKAMLWGIDMEVARSEDDRLSVRFFGHGSDEHMIRGKLVVVEPPDLVWN